MTRPLLDAEGENRAVRSFLMFYGANSGLTVGQMRQNLHECGYPYWPDWTTGNQKEHLTKGGAQNWLRYLFALEARDDSL